MTSDTVDTKSTKLIFIEACCTGLQCVLCVCMYVCVCVCVSKLSETNKTSLTLEITLTIVDFDGFFCFENLKHMT